MMIAFLTEDKLKSSERTDFGLPEQKKYPMPDHAHVLAAIRMFNHVDKANEARLAHAIKAKMKQYGISNDQVGEKNRLKQYLNESDNSQNKKPKNRFIHVDLKIPCKVKKEIKTQFTADNIGKETSSAVCGALGGVVGGIPGIVGGSLLGRVGYEAGKASANKLKQFI